MKFTRLRVTGFKSFVDPTELAIEPGLTGIVGPNGCGKSNIVEALRWVMGETSAKSLRGSGMEDVIFSGTSGRPARNSAEVVLSIDNEDRRAPPAFNDAESLDITRRIERDAGSAYRINGKDVRAKDVQLLFADLSSGAHSPAMVRQGQISILVNAKPQNRRMILEEAAGISGLHSRRHEAELRLRAAETNLQRLDDVVQQLESQLGSLKRQAKQAARYRTLSDQIRKAEAIVLFLRWKEASDGVLAGEAAFRELEQTVARLTQDAASAARLQANEAEGLPALREAEAAAAAALHRLTVERDTLDAEENRARQEAERLERQLAQITADIEREQAGLADGADELERLTAEAEALNAQETGHDERLAAAQTEADADKAALSEAEKALETATQEAAQFQARRSGLSRQKTELEARATRLSRDLDKVVSERRDLEAQGGDPAALEGAQAAVTEAEAQVSAAETAAGEAEQARGEAQSAERAAREPTQDADRSVSALEAEAKTLARMLTTEDHDLWPPVVDAIQVEPGYEAALGAALGDDLDVPADDAAPMHWATLDPLDPVPALPAEARPLSDLVQGPPALTRRLSQIGLVSDTEGKALQAHLKPGQRLVSRDGDLWRWDGMTVAADAPTPAAVRLAQRNRLAELDQELEAARQAARDAREAAHAARQRAEQAAEAERSARQDVRDAGRTLATARTRLAETEKTANRHAARLAALGEAQTRLDAELAEVSETLSTVSADLEQVGDGSELTDAVTGVKDQVHGLRLKGTDSRAALESLRRDGETRRARLDAIDKTRSGWESRSQGAVAQLEQLAVRKAATAEELETARAVPDQITQRRDGLIEALDMAEARRNVAANALQEAENRLREVDSRAKTLQSDVATAREDRARQEATLIAVRERVEDVAARIREALDCAPEEVLDAGGVESGEVLPPLEEIERRLERLKRERDNMGAVNLRADEESQEYTSQLDSMNAEREDLIQAIARLRQGISSLNKEGRERLLAAFGIVNEHFTRLFTSLFGGGTAHLELVESDDPLEAGLEIFARPPGKKLQSLSLLSGGEQALTAMSLIFAVFLSNPAPICVLDEVDAPLDDANVERFCNLLDEITRNTETRFLIITHHALTMSRMNRLYGVTMAERGVSQLVSVNLQEAERVVAAE